MKVRALLWTSMALFASGFSTLAIIRHRAFETNRFDLGNMVQAVWSTAHGDFLATTAVGGEQTSRLAAHFDPLLAAFAPLWLVWPSPEMLLVTQAIGVALGALPVFWLVRKHLQSERTALAFSVAYLLYPPVQWLVLDDFHPVAFACPLLLAAFWYLDENRLLPFAVSSGLAMLTKEEIGLVVAGFGIWYLMATRRRVASAVIVAAGLAVSIAAVEVVVPHFNDAPSPFYSRYRAVGGSPGGIAETTFNHPVRLLQEVVTGHDGGYLLRLLLPLGALCLLAPLALVAALPELGLNLLSSVPTQSSIRFHYTAGLIPPLFAATVLGAAVLLRREPRAKPWLGRGLIALALVATFAVGPSPVLGALRRHVTEHDRRAIQALRLIPRDAVVSASNSFGAHLSARRRIFSLPRVEGATWAAVDEEHPSYFDRYAPVEAAGALGVLRRDSAWRTVFDRDGIVIFRRISRAP